MSFITPPPTPEPVVWAEPASATPAPKQPAKKGALEAFVFVLVAAGLLFLYLAFVNKYCRHCKDQCSFGKRFAPKAKKGE